MSILKEFDPEIYDAIEKETDRQEYKLEMIASENYVSRAVLEAAGSVMTNKYAEGLPHKRYYGGCEYVDVAEDLARERVKKLFGCEAVNVQPHSGSQANMAVYFSALKPGDTVMGMNLSEGGHLTHGSPVNFSGFLFNVVSYGLNSETERIDMNQVRDLAKKHRPKMIVVGASAYPRKIEFKPFREIADEVGATVLADIAHPAGLVATGLHPDPIPYCEFVTTTTHKTLRGPRGGIVMMKEDWAKKVNSKVFPGIQGGPLMHIIAAKAVAFKEDLEPDFTKYCEQIIKNCQTLCEVFNEAGFKLVSGGSDNHLLLMDLSDREYTGKDAEEALGRAGITVNKNTVPNEQRSPFITSGIRVGTPALTTRGFKEAEMKQVGEWMVEVLQDIGNEARQSQVLNEVKALCKKFPLYR